MSCGHGEGIDVNLLFFFLLLILLFCKPGIFGCGEDSCDSCNSCNVTACGC